MAPPKDSTQHTTHVYAHVVREDDNLFVKGLRREKDDKQGWLFEESDQGLSKHPAVETFLRNQNVISYRNVKIEGTALAQYYDFDSDRFFFNGKFLKEDVEMSLSTDEDGKQLTKCLSSFKKLILLNKMQICVTFHSQKP